MRLLLDTNVLLRWAEGRSLSKDAAAAINDVENEAFVSVVTVWEMGVKFSVGAVQVTPTTGEALAELGVELLELTIAGAQRLASLPLHHRDPFDRMLVAQVLEESLTLVTTDQQLARYGIATIAA